MVRSAFMCSWNFRTCRDSSRSNFRPSALVHREVEHQERLGTLRKRRQQLCQKLLSCRKNPVNFLHLGSTSFSSFRPQAIWEAEIPEIQGPQSLLEETRRIGGRLVEAIFAHGKGDTLRHLFWRKRHGIQWVLGGICQWFVYFPRLHTEFELENRRDSGDGFSPPRFVYEK